MSHELRSPLNAILGFAQLLESTSPLPTASQKENIAHILQAGWHLLELINEVLDLAVVESGTLSISPEPASLTEVMSECKAMMEPAGATACHHHDLSPPASAGISIYPLHGEDADTLLKNADLALYETKRAGKNAYRISGTQTCRR